MNIARALLLCVPLASLSACANVDDDPSANASQPIIDGTAATSWMWRSAARISGCTATIIGPRHLLTASHCLPAVGGPVRFYRGTIPDATSHSISAVSFPPGVNAAAGDYQDSDNEFADIAVVRLDDVIPGTSTPAEISRSYPGANVFGYAVGSGRHDGYDNDDRDLRYHSDTTYSSSAGDGHFLNNNVWTNPGDSGGPFYIGRRLTGVLYGYVFEWQYRNKYTNIPYHRVWVLDAMGYTGPFTTYANSMVTGGALLQTFVAYSQRECAYACEWNDSCRAWSYMPIFGNQGICYLRDASSPRSTLAGMTSGVRQ